MGLTVVTPAAIEPVSVQEIRLYLRQDSDCEDQTIRGLIRAATEYAQMIQRRQLVKATLRLTLDGFTNPIYLMRPPVQSVSSITYVDENGASQTLAADQYASFLTDAEPRVVTAYDVVWPSTTTQPGAVAVNYVAGYGATGGTNQQSADAVPQSTKLAIKRLVVHWFDQRVEGDIPPDVAALLAVDSWGHYASSC